MTPAELDEIFHRTLDDKKLSRGERKALTQILTDEQPDKDQLAVFRHEAFAVAREHMHDPRDRQVAGWLEDVCKLLLPPTDAMAVAEARFSPGQDCVRRVISLFAHARSSVDICVFTITDDRIADAIIEAHGRGVAIGVITDDMKAMDRGSDIERLRRAGIEVRLVLGRAERQIPCLAVGPGKGHADQFGPTRPNAGRFGIKRDGFLMAQSRKERAERIGCVDEMGGERRRGIRDWGLGTRDF